MTSESSSVVIVVVMGPQASGKSTVASALGAELRRLDELVAVVELDQVASMARPTLPSWDVAAHIFAIVAGEWARAGLTCVVAEGIATRAELALLLDHVPASVAVVTVLMTTPFETAALRAQSDVGRGPTSSSRDRGWLAIRYQEWSLEMSQLPADVLLDTSAFSNEQSVKLIIKAVVSARSPLR